MVTIENANFCISELLKSRTEEHLECLCKFISTIGKTYEKEYDAKVSLSLYMGDKKIIKFVLFITSKRAQALSE